MAQEIVDSAGQRFHPDTRYLGGRGPIRITGTSAVTGQFYALIPEADGCTLSALLGIGGSWSGCKPPASGIWAGVGGVITSVTLSAGAAIAYQI